MEDNQTSVPNLDQPLTTSPQSIPDTPKPVRKNKAVGHRGQGSDVSSRLSFLLLTQYGPR